MEHPAGHHAPARSGQADGHDHRAMVANFRRRFFVTLALTPPVLLLSPMIRDALGLGAILSFPGDSYVLALLATVAWIYGGWPFLTGFVSEMRRLQPGMMTLVAMAITVAWAYSVSITFGLPGMEFYWELVTLIAIMQLGHWIEMRSVMGASRALEELVRLLPDVAVRLEEDGSQRDVPVDDLRAGDRVLIKPGAKAPVDGVVEEGESGFNEAMLTGESRPVARRPGDTVNGGAINGAGAVVMTVKATGEATYLSQVIALVRRAQESRSRTQDFADRAAAWLTGIVLVIACPHALGLAVPLVVAVSTALSAGNGLLIRDRAAFERARRLDTVVFDKTGTLTEGRFGVTDIVPLGREDEAAVLRLAAAVESRSEHPIAGAIGERARHEGLAIPEPKEATNLPGEGISARVDGEALAVVSPGHLARRGREVTEARLRDLEAEGKTVVVLTRGDAPVALFALADRIRTEAREAVQKLSALGVRPIILTGDVAGVARAVANQLGITEFMAGVLPDQKAAKIRELMRAGRRVAMVGDGVNDAPALVEADLGVAIGAGTDVAVESADVVLVRSDPRDVAAILGLARATYAKMVQNLFWATAYNAVAIPMAAGVTFGSGLLMTPAIGAALMSLSTVIVAINAQLLRLRAG